VTGFSEGGSVRAVVIRPVLVIFVDFAVGVVAFAAVKSRNGFRFAVTALYAAGIALVEIVPVDTAAVVGTVDIAAVDIGIVAVVNIFRAEGIEILAAYDKE